MTRVAVSPRLLNKCGKGKIIAGFLSIIFFSSKFLKMYKVSNEIISRFFKTQLLNIFI